MFIVDKIVGWLAPYNCLVCGDEGDIVCAWCLPEVAERLPERCFRCQALSAGSSVCVRCRRHAPLAHVWVRAQYKGAPKLLVHVLKFERASAAAQPIAQLMSDSLPYLNEDTIIAAVPTATNRVRLRGYDQAERIAKYLSAMTGLQHKKLLIRMGQTRQVGASKQARSRQLAESFRVAGNGHTAQGARILLVDDVVTTGATLAAAARCLRDAGAKRVDAVVFAQKQ